MVLRENYLLPFGVKALTLSETANRITGRSLVFITDAYKLFHVPQISYSARRPHKDQLPKEKGWFSLPDPEELEAELAGIEKPMEEQLKSAKFQVYDPVIPQFDSRHLSYDLPLIGVESLRSFPTRLESTSQIFAYGHDLFLSRLRPDNRFDMIDEDFNYSLLFLVIAGLIVATFAFQKYLKAGKAKKAFLVH